MPFVEVWVDDEPCDGTCKHADQRDEALVKIDEAVRLLRQGEVKAALHALTGDAELGVKSPKEIEAQYARFKKGELPGFVRFNG